MLATMENVENLNYLYPGHPLLEVVQDRERTIANLRVQVADMEYQLARFKRVQKGRDNGGGGWGYYSVPMQTEQRQVGGDGDDHASQSVRRGGGRGAVAG